MVLAEELDNAAFLRQFAPDYRNKIAGLARLKEYQPDDVIFAEGEHCPDVYLVLDGEVGLEIRVPRWGLVEALRVGPGELLGWSPVLGGGAMTATAVSATRCRLAALAADEVVALADRDPRFGLEFFRRTSAALAERVHATRLQIPGPARDRFRALAEGADLRGPHRGARLPHRGRGRRAGLPSRQARDWGRQAGAQQTRPSRACPCATGPLPERHGPTPRRAGQTGGPHGVGCSAG